MDRLSEDQKLVLETFDKVVKDGFGTVTFKVHRHRLVGRERSHKDDVPRLRVKEVDDANGS